MADNETPVTDPSSIYGVNDQGEATLRVTENGTGDASSIYCVNDEGEACMRVSENVTSDDPTSIYGVNEEGKASVRVIGAGGGTVINNEDINVTSNGEYTAGEGYTGLGKVNVNVPNPSTGTKNITSNGIYNVADFASADVQVPTTAPACYQEFEISNNKLRKKPQMPNLSGVTNLDGRVFEYLFSEQPCPSTVSFGTVSTISGERACYNMFSYTRGYNSSTMAVDMSSVTTISGQNACEKMFDKSRISSIDLSNLSSVLGNACCVGMFNECSYLSGNISLPSLITATVSSALNGMFYKCTGITSVTLNLEQIGPSSGVSDSITTGMFSGCSSLQTADLSKLKYVYRKYQLSNFFYGCTSLTQVNLDSMTATGMEDGLYRCFYGCSLLPEVEFLSLYSIGYTAFRQAFYSCTSLTDLWFPSITSTSFGSYNNAFNGMFDSSVGCTVHFPKNLDPQTGDTTISSLSGYPTFGGTNIVLAFDLPATNTLTGADTNTYSRNPKYDTATALAWKVGAYGTANFDPAYYTSGTTDPAVGDTIYSDSACTAAVTTIGTIA